ncbi:hypothetical protein G7054_g6979 [Neopestalotiopsis clavispora]|nr:hypothetical protein G7054_g6979 [Neopestalotiopsis clavispora]
MLRLQDCIRSNWPAITKNVHMDHMDDVYSVVPFSGEDPSKLFEKASGWLILLHSLPQDQKSRVDVIERQLRLSMIDAVFGSNQIDGAGLDPHMTAGLCDRVFGGEDVKIINENTPGYETMLHFELCAHLGIGEDNVMIHDWASYIRQRTEVVNHAKAFQYIIDQVVSRDLPITQRLITTTHTILCQVFTPPSRVPEAMIAMIAELNQDLEYARQHNHNQIDPFALAAKYSMRFAQIHPFQDGNSPMSRLILNAILCKYTGIVVPIGENQEDKDAYLNLTALHHGEYAIFVLKKTEVRLRSL